MNKMGFRLKIICFLAIMIFAASFVLVGISIAGSRSALMSFAKDGLLSSGHLVTQTMDRYQSKLIEFAVQIADSRLVEGMFIAYEGGFYGASLEPGTDQNIFKSYFENLNKSFFERSTKLARDADFSDLLMVATSGQVFFLWQKLRSRINFWDET